MNVNKDNSTLLFDQKAGVFFPNRVPIIPKYSRKLKKRIAAFGLALAMGVGTLTACSFLGNNSKKEQKNNDKPTTSTISTISTTVPVLEQNDELKEGLRFDPNSRESIANNAVYLIEEAAKCGKKLDAEDAILSVIVANSNELTAGFMGELFGERADQTYTYGTLVDAYLRLCMMQVENIGISKNDDMAFNIENIFAKEEDYNYLYNIRNLTNRFNNTIDKYEKEKITNELNQIALDLCTYEVYDISSSAGVLSMLSLDGMRMITNNSDNPILHDDIRDEMFGNEDYACNRKETFVNEKGVVLQTAYSYRVNDVKLDNIKSKLENAILKEGKSIILDDIILEVKERTKDVIVSDFNMVEEINKKREENRFISFEYESAPGVKKENYSEKKDDDVVANVGGKDVIVIPGNTIGNSTTTPAKPKQENQTTSQETTTPTEPTPDATTPVITPTIQNPEVTTPTEPEIKVEENVTPKPNEEVKDSKEIAEDKLQDEWAKAQADSNQGTIDGEYYGSHGLSKPSLEGKSDYYINAFNASYDFWFKIYTDAKAQEEQQKNENDTVESEDTISQETTTEPEETEAVTDEMFAAIGAITGSGNSKEEPSKILIKRK